MGLTCFKSWKYDSRGQKGNRDVLASPGSYFFLSNSCGQGDEWLQSLNKRAWIPFTGVFGQRLEETVLYERRYGARSVPLVVEQCVHFIRERGLHEVGLFRCPGQATLVKDLQEAFDAGERPSFDSGTDVHTVASLLKLYLRQLPEPLVPYSQYQNFLLCGEQLVSGRTKGLLELRGLLHDLPVANFNLLNYICQFLNEVQSYSCSNKMSCQNLATVFGPNILRAKAEDPHSIIGGAAVVQVLMLELIREHQSLFPRDAGPCPARPKGKPQDPTLTSPRAPLLPVSPCARQLSLPLIAERWGRPGSVSSLKDTREHPSPPPHPPQSASKHCDQSHAADPRLPAGQKRVLGHRHTSSHPDSCLFPLPSTSYPLSPLHHQHRYHAAGPSTPQPDEQFSGGAQDSIPGLGSNAVPTGLFPARAAPSLVLQSHTADSPASGALLPGRKEEEACPWTGETEERKEGGVVPEADSGGSSEYQEDSTMSVYDNLSRASLHQRMEVGDSDPFDADAAAMHLDSSLIVREGAGEEEAQHSLVSSFSFSSCELLPVDKTGDCVTECGSSPCQSLRSSPMFLSNHGSEDNDRYEEEDDDDSGDEDDDDVEDAIDDDNPNGDLQPPNSPASCSVPSDMPLSTGSSEVFLSSGSPDPQRSQAQTEAQNVHSYLAELKQQMTRQRAEYQATISRLERCNEALEGQMAALCSRLEQHKRWHSLAEVKIRNVERARVDADRRNATLQREMEQFFKTFGEVKGGGGGRGGGRRGRGGRGGERTRERRNLQSL